MLKRLLITVLIAAAVGASCPCSAEMRGAWMGAWWPGYYDAEQIDASVAAAKKAGINALFIQVRKNADAYYKSDIEPRGSGIAAGFDPLAYAIDKAHAQGIQVHAWVNALRVGSATPPKDAKNVVNAHPEWLTKTADGETLSSGSVFLDPGVPAAREYVAKVMLDIVKRYDVDGIQWDYIRYPDSKFGYADAALARYYAESGTTTKPDPKDSKWVQWKRDQVSTLVRDVYKQIHAIKPKITVSASTIAWGTCAADYTDIEAYWRVCQDWKAWMAEGTIDANLPMCYKAEHTESGASSFRGWLSSFAKWSGGRATYVGIDVDGNDDAAVLTQIQAVRKAGLAGYVLYKFNQNERRNSLVQAMAAAAKTAPAAPESASSTKPAEPAVTPDSGKAKLAPSLVVH